MYLVSFEMFKVTYSFFFNLPSLCKTTAKGHIFLPYFYLERARISYIIHTQDYINQGPIKKENTWEISLRSQLLRNRHLGLDSMGENHIIYVSKLLCKWDSAIPCKKQN